MALVLGLAFCAVAPLIAPVALLYFVLCGAAQRYQMAYVLSRPYEASGRMWSSVSSRIICEYMRFVVFNDCLLVCAVLVLFYPTPTHQDHPAPRQPPHSPPPPKLTPP
jgi:hypothetical protein